MSTSWLVLLLLHFYRFFIKKVARSLGCSSGLDYSWPLWTFKKALKTNGFSTFSLFGPTKPEHICITLVISCLQADLSSFCSIFVVFSSKLAPTAQLQFRFRLTVAPLNLQKSFKNQWFFNVFAFRPHQAHTSTHYTCHNNENARKASKSRSLEVSKPRVASAGIAKRNQ